MIVRYKSKPDRIRSTNSFNTQALCEVLTGDDSMYIQDLEVKIGDTWKCMAQAFKDRDIIPNNLNTHFGEPTSQANKDRGYND